MTVRAKTTTNPITTAWPRTRIRSRKPPVGTAAATSAGPRPVSQCWHLQDGDRILPNVTVSAAELGVIRPLRRTHHGAGVYGGEERPHGIGSEDTTASEGQLSPERRAAADAEQG